MMRLLFALMLLSTLPVAAQDPGSLNKPEALYLCSRAGVVPPCIKYPPKPLKNPDPEYSEEARAQKINASAIVSFVVEVDGSVDDITIERSPGYGLDEKALEALKQWKFKPGRMGDKTPARTKLQVRFSWNLH